MESAKPSAILAEIEKRTGNPFALGKKVNDEVLDRFEARDESYWSVLERLCRVSNNAYGTEAFRDGG
jgi:hypothetical protein